jgi:hypothetical protein
MFNLVHKFEVSYTEGPGKDELCINAPAFFSNR